MKAYIIIVKKAAKKQYAKFLDYLYQTFGAEGYVQAVRPQVHPAD